MKSALVRILVLLLASLAAVAAWVAVAGLQPGLVVQAIVALAAFLIVGRVLLPLTDRPPASGRSTRRWLIGGAVVYAVTAQGFVGRPPERVLEEPVPPEGLLYWELPDGGRLAYLPALSGSDTDLPPIVWLHDGPGIPILPLVRTGVPPLPDLGDLDFDVYLYDQRGAGFSSRLDLRREDPYTVAGHVGDLEEVRRILGVERLILAGHGWGANLAVSYLLAHPQRVDRMILLSPAPLWYPGAEDFVEPSARARLDEVQTSALALLERPTLRLLIGRLTSSTSRAAAHALVADWEADQWWTAGTRESWRLGQPRMTCQANPSGGLPVPTGLGYFAYSYTMQDALTLPDPRPALSAIRTPVLVLRGLCDWVQSSVANEYIEALPGAEYVPVPGAGHLIWLEMASLQRQVIRDFLLGNPLPLSFYRPAR